MASIHEPAQIKTEKEKVEEEDVPMAPSGNEGEYHLTAPRRQ